ncbi:MAG TPA: hypothetical protein ENF17_11135 [Candidatus Aminicenantes bacterium]|nr:hypothetical protein [Candidatus Aminicenantes bacterium]
MKKLSLALIGLIIFTGICFSDFNIVDKDLQVVRKAVRENPNYRAGKQVTWFKFVVYDLEKKRNKVKITLPIGLVEWMIQFVEDEELEIDCSQKRLKIRELWQELKKLGAKSLIEIYSEEDGELVKVWLE